MKKNIYLTKINLKKMITRIVKLKGFNNLIAGRDLANILEDGHVYSVNKIDGQIIMKDLGEHAHPENFIGLTFTQIILDGF